jgi:hypothetical protein
MLSTSENLIENYPHLFPHVELVNSSDVFKGYEFNEWEQKAIVIHKPEGGFHVGGLASEKYSLVKNEDLFLPIADKLDSLFGEKNIDIRVKYSKSFEYHLFFEMKGLQTNEMDSLYPMSEATNSYTTQILAAQRNMIGRLICTNGMMTIAEKALLFAVKHTKSETGIFMDMDTLLKDTELLFNDFGVITEHKEVMNNVNLSALKGANNIERFESIVKGTNFPKKQIETAYNIALREASQLKQNLTLWLAYNGFNHILNHDKETKMTQNMKNVLDAKLVNKVHNLALSLA